MQEGMAQTNTQKSLDSTQKGKAVILSAPSGSGKTSIVKGLLSRCVNLEFSISACTRPRRSHEQDGIDYYFLALQEFKDKIEQGEFIEYEEVYENTYYGTLKSEIERIWNQGKHVIFDVDVKGGLQLKSHFKDAALALFISVPSFEVLEQRLRSRETESEAHIQERLEKSKEEMAYENSFDQVIINDRLEDAIREVESLIQDFTTVS